MITKTIATEHGNIKHDAEVTHTDSGQLVIHIVSTLGAVKHEHRVTVGAEDGQDGSISRCAVCGRSEVLKTIKSLSEEEIQAAIQKHLDDKRAEAERILIGRAIAVKVAANLT
jgi:hypothetical protein